MLDSFFIFLAKISTMNAHIAGVCILLLVIMICSEIMFRAKKAGMDEMAEIMKNFIVGSLILGTLFLFSGVMDSSAAPVQTNQTSTDHDKGG